MENNRMGEFLAALRKSKGYTQQEVADTLGVSNKTVSSWETGASCPDISMLPVLAELYGVTCDEIIRGKRMSSEEEFSPAERKKAMEHLLQRLKTNLFTVCWIAGGLTGVALFLTSLIGFAALESLIGFFVGLIFQAASIITTVICIRRLRFQAGEPWESEPAFRFSLSLEKALFWIAFANAAVFGFDLPHSFVPAEAGLLFEGETLLLQLLFALGAAALFIGIPILFHHRKKLLNGSTERGLSELSGSFGALIRKNRLFLWRFKHLLLIILLPALILAAACGTLLAILINSDYSKKIIFSMSSFICVPEEIDEELDQEGAFAESSYTLVSEEQPETENETGKYEVVYLFPSFPENWRGYYRMQETVDGTLVTIYKYRTEIKGTDDIIDLYAYDYRWQGGIRAFEVRPLNEPNETGELYISLIIDPDIPTQEWLDARDRNHAILLGSTIGCGALFLLSFAVTIPFYVKQERKFKKTL